MTNRRIVGPHSGGGWQVKAPGAQRASAVGRTQGELIGRARAILGNVGGGELRIQGRNGQIRDSDTVAPGSDPCPARDKR